MSEHDVEAVVPSTEQQAGLAEVFVLLADTLVDDFDVIEVLERLVHACVELLGASAAALMLTQPNGGIAVAAASEERSELLDLYQIQNDEGPCLDCIRSGTAVLGTDLAREPNRWPTFSREALALGFRSVNAFPLRLRSQTIGGLNVFHGSTAPFGAADARVAQAMADAATIGILQQRALHQSNTLGEQLRRALDSRIVVEQAKGMLAEFTSTSPQEAFLVLREYCRNNNLKLSETARQLTERALDLETVAHPPSRSRT